MAEMAEQKRAVVTGASAGIGAATVRALVGEGYRVVMGARRLDRLQELAEDTGAVGLALDVTDGESVARFAEQAGAIELLVNNAGFGSPMTPVAEDRPEAWAAMYETNVVGVLRMVRAFMPQLLAAGNRVGRGHVVNVGSIAGFEVYPGGGGYAASKHALRAVTKTLRLELLGKPVRVTEICPGMVETEFSLVRFEGDSARAQAVYQGMEPLLAGDIADCIVWAATRPSHVNIDEIVVRPRDQATAYAVHRSD